MLEGFIIVFGFAWLVRYPKPRPAPKRRAGIHF